MQANRQRRWFWAPLWWAISLCGGLTALPAAAQVQSLLARGEATGLIIGLKDSPTEAVTAERAVGRERQQWESASFKGRERLRRLAKEAGLPQGVVGDAGNAQLLRFERPMRGDALANAVRRARLHPDVAWVEPDVLVPRLAVPNDPGFSLNPGGQWHLQAPGPGNLAALNLPDAWDITLGSASTVVAVVDSGIRFDHPDLPTLASGRMLPGRDMVSELAIANDGDGRDADPSDPGDGIDASDQAQLIFAGCNLMPSSWHGTFIAGQIGAQTNNAIGVAGLNWNTRILPVRVSGKCGARLSDLLDGVRWAAGLPVNGQPTNPNPARVINLSFGGDRTCASAPGYQSTIDAVTSAGALVVVAAGNTDRTLLRPADCRRVMAVASVRRDGLKAEYSSFGSNVALSAPGGAMPDNPADDDRLTLMLSHSDQGLMGPTAPTFEYKQGTSFAAPQAAGVASLMLSVNPFLNPRQLIDRMKAGARLHETVIGRPTCGTPGTGVCNCTATTCGAGMLDANTSAQLATGPAVVIKPLGTVEPGTVITLDGSSSVAIPGRSIVSYQWVQVGGPPVSITADRSAVAKATLVSEATYEFSLSIADNFGRRGEDSVVVVAAMPAPPARGGGGGSAGLLWGLGLWAWVLAMVLRQRRRQRLR
ncbi:S8 family serine peptidase [Hydrogenophaga sp. BPS33]|uniref:S8 family serine peptidase n=1 Tax=Hydrogenophaga sp. BPS33 TaxID=2651974 RepID=UPI00135CD951|nr:S8 family serine peptidase [Hydrogenophaga sp. BPS33]